MSRMHAKNAGAKEDRGLGPSTTHETRLETSYLQPWAKSEKNFCSRAENRYIHSTAWGRVKLSGLYLNGILRPRGRVWMWVPIEAG